MHNNQDQNVLGLLNYVISACNNGQSTVIDCRNSVCDQRKASINRHHDCQYLDVTTTSQLFCNFF